MQNFFSTSKKPPLTIQLQNSSNFTNSPLPILLKTLQLHKLSTLSPYFMQKTLPSKLTLAKKLVQKKLPTTTISHTKLKRSCNRREIKNLNQLKNLHIPLHFPTRPFKQLNFCKNSIINMRFVAQIALIFLLIGELEAIRCYEDRIDKPVATQCSKKDNACLTTYKDNKITGYRW